MSVLLSMLLAGVQPGRAAEVDASAPTARGILQVAWGDPLRPELGEVEARFDLAH